LSNRTSRFAEDDDLRVLAVRHLSGELDADQVERFFGRLAENSRFVDDYLTTVFQSRLLPKCLLTDSLIADEKSAAHESATRSSETGSSPVLSFLGVAKLTRRGWWSVPRLVAAVISSGIVLYFAVLILLLAWERNGREGIVGQISDGSAESPAKIVAAIDSRWASPQQPLNDGDSLNRGPVRLAGGRIEIRFDRGARMIVEGPANFEVRSSNSVFLSSGMIVAKVPPQAIGFSVETPTATVVDLGTEFGVEVGKSGATEVQVLAGKVELQLAISVPKPSAREQPITLTAGEARTIEAGVNGAEPVVRKIAAAPGRFARMAETSGVRRIAVHGALASSTFPFPLVSVNNLINGSGMRGECHTSKSVDGTVWHTEIGKVKNEYVLFDLGLPSRLRSMKVWNYNEDFDSCYLWRGVKQADVYTSNTGRGTPLDHPEEWTLVAEDVQFEPGSGTSEYNTPTQIQLNDVNARFVAIVIDEAQGHDPRVKISSAPYYGDVVGLSEVQFFGERVKSAPSKSRQ
jgi:hypothetical protein